jgi:hypothetical protein
MTEVNSTALPFQVAGVTSTTFQLNDIDGNNVDTSAYTAYSSAGTVTPIYEISSPYTTAQVQELQTIQSGTTMYIAHPDVSPRTLVRNSNADWTIDTIDFYPPPTYESGLLYENPIVVTATTGVDKHVVFGAEDATGGTYRWIASGSGTNEYYMQTSAGADPSLDTPRAVLENLTLMTEGTVGTLAAGEYDYGDNDTLGYSTLYVRLSDGTDPDTKASEYVIFSDTDVILTGDEGRQVINLSTGETGRASITELVTGGLAKVDIVEDFTDTSIIASGDSKLDLSPLVDLEMDSTQAGAITTVRSEYNSGSLGDKFTITGVTNANPAVVTTSAAHGYANGDTVQIKDIVGMTQINDKQFTVEGVASTTFQLKGEDSTGFTTYSSGGNVRQALSGLSKNGFRSADVGKYILVNGGVMQIVSITDVTTITAEIIKSLNNKDTTGNWTLEIDTWDATRGYPRSVGLYEQRLIFGGTTAQPQTIWMSEIGIFDGFGIGPDDEDSIEIDLVSNEVNEINWIAAGRDLVIGTSGGEMTVNSGSSTSVSPNTIQLQPRTYHGSTRQQVLNIKDEVIFLQGSNRKIRSFRYDFNVDGYVGEALTFLAEHITEGGVEELAYAQEPDTILYAVTTNGELLSSTYDRPKKVIGWGRYTTDGNYENVQTITKDEEDQVWTVVNRTINSNTRRYVELFTFGTGEDDLDGFSDTHLTLSTPVAISGITVADPAVVTTGTSHGYSNGDSVIIKDLQDPLSSDLDSTKTNMSSLNQGTYIVANKTSTTFELTNVDTSGYNSYGSSGNVWSKSTTISGLDHLEGKTVQIKVDGATHADKVVSSGALTLDASGGEVVIGLPYTTTIKTLNTEFDVGLGSMQGQRARWARPLIRVYKSTRALVNGEFLPARNTANLLGQRVPLFSGYLEYGSLDWDSTTSLTITVSDPLPFKLTGITGTIDAGIK